MKKQIRIGFLLAVILPLFYSCASTEQKEKPAFVDKNHTLTELVVTGLLKVGSDFEITVTEKPESRGRVTFILTGEVSFLEAAKKFDGKFVEVRGKLESVSTPWKKTLRLNAIRGKADKVVSD